MTRRVLHITIYDDLLSLEEAKAIEQAIRDYLDITEPRYVKWSLRQDGFSAA